MLDIFIGAFAGFISGFFGAGGGLILVPAFTYINKLNEKESRATSILCILPLVTISFLIYMNYKQLDWKIGIKSAIGGIIGAIIGSCLLKKINNQILNGMFSIFLIYAAIRMVFF